MCRMLAMASNSQLAVKYLLDFMQLAHTGKVASGRKPGHTDGWGIVGYRDASPVYAGRQPTDAFNDPLYLTACRSLIDKKINRITFAQLRKRSIGRISLDNTPPLVIDKFCFMHNGTVHNLGNEKSSDSTILHQMILDALAKGHSLVESLRSVYGKICASYNYTSLTSMITDGSSIYAVRRVKREKDEDYYGLMYAKNRNSLVISQEPSWEMNWKEIDNGEILIVKSDLALETERL